MRLRHASRFLVIVLTGFVSSAFAQGPNDGYILDAEAASHQLSHSEPVYPPIAKAVHIQGSVLLHLQVDASGSVTSVEAIGGPEMLRGAAKEAAMHWTYQPFQVDGKSAPVRLAVSVLFSLGIPDAIEKSDQAIGQAFFPEADRCRAANHADHWADAVKICADLVAIADRFPDQQLRHLEIMDAHRDYGEALAFSGDMPAALPQLQQAVAIADKFLKPTDAEYGGVYYWRAFCEHASHMPAEADRDYTTSETALRQAMVILPDMDKEYGRELAHVLAYHAVLETQTGHPEAAAKLRAEAVSLNPRALDPTQ